MIFIIIYIIITILSLYFLNKIRKMLIPNKAIKNKIATIAWVVFLWAIEMKEEEYWKECHKMINNKIK